MDTTELAWACAAALSTIACTSSSPANPSDAGAGNDAAAVSDAAGDDGASAGGTWQRLSGGSGAAWPEARGYADLVLDPSTGRVLLVSGEASVTVDLQNFDWASHLPNNGGVWALDPVAGQWSRIADTNPTQEDGVAYDTKAARLIAHVSYRSNGSTHPDRVSETWAFDPATGTWEDRNPAQSPPVGLVLGGAQMVYSTKSDRIVLFGGFDIVQNAFSNATWVYDGTANTWTNMAPPVSPPARNSHALVYDEAADRVILFGGDDIDTAFDDTWAYDLHANTWTERKPAAGPSGRCYVHLAYSAAQDRIVMFGGVGYPDETRLNDETWLYGYSANTWTRLTPTGGPGLRGWYAMAYSPTADAMVLFGGGVDRGHFTDEAWLYKLPVSR